LKQSCTTEEWVERKFSGVLVEAFLSAKAFARVFFHSFAWQFLFVPKASIIAEVDVHVGGTDGGAMNPCVKLSWLKVLAQLLRQEVLLPCSLTHAAGTCTTSKLYLSPPKIARVVVYFRLYP
jgi:hypothetical protein